MTMTMILLINELISKHFQFTYP